MKYQQLLITFYGSTPANDIGLVEKQLSGLVSHMRFEKYRGRYTDFNLPDETYEFSYFSEDNEDPYMFARIIGGNLQIKDICTLGDLFESQLGKKRI